LRRGRGSDAPLRRIDRIARNEGGDSRELRVRTSDSTRGWIGWGPEKGDGRGDDAERGKRNKTGGGDAGVNNAVEWNFLVV
jgi:hypothetical protein